MTHPGLGLVFAYALCVSLWAVDRLAVAAVGGRCLGLGWAKLWVRRGKITTERRQRLLAAKEAQGWQAGSPPLKQYWLEPNRSRCGQSEADIYESWARPRRANLHLLVRAAQNRSVWGGDSLCGDHIEDGFSSMKTFGQLGMKPLQPGDQLFG